MKRIPIKSAKEFGIKHDQDQVIIISYNNKTNMMSVVTWGKSVDDCLQASIAGNAYKKMLGFPPEKCKDVPVRVKRMKQKSKIHSSTDPDVNNGIL